MFPFSRAGRSYTHCLVEDANRQMTWMKHVITRAHVQLEI